jgi:hypothetical protein
MAKEISFRLTQNYDEFRLKIYELICKVIQLRLAHDIWRFVLKSLGFVMVLGGS